MTRPLLACLALAAGASLLAGCATAPAGPPELGTDELEQQVKADLDARWESWMPAGSIQPTVPRIAFTTLDTSSATQVQCLQDAGMTAGTVSGGYVVDGPGTDTDIALAMWICTAQYPVDPRAYGYLGVDQLLYAYDYFADRVGPCLELLGYPVPPAPSRLSFVGSVRAGDFWSPYDFSAAGESLAYDDLAYVNFRCPPLPETPYSDFQPQAWVRAGWIEG